MRRPSKSPSRKLSSDSHRLVSLAQGLVQSSSRLEERAWERCLDTLLHKLLKTNHQDTLDTALDHLFKADLGAYDALMESVEACSESCTIEHDEVSYDALLIAVPILAWTRFSIASGPIPADVVATLSAHLHAHLLAADTKLAIAPTLFAIDQLPRSHAETFAVIQRMAHAAMTGAHIRPLANPPETAPFLADTRYLLAAVVVRAGEPMFHWQTTMNPADREGALDQWRAQATPNIVRLLPGCSVELLLPEAYYVACREADKAIRPASIRAAVHFLTHTLGVEPSGLRAVIGGFSEDPLSGRVDEYRIGFTLRQSPDVVYGLVWPLYGQEDEEEANEATLEVLISPEDAAVDGRQTPIEEILLLLRECGIVHIKRHNERFPVEFCEDCGAPLYPDPDAELVHAEMPEDAPAGTGHFH
ncbi:MAG: hypothetical protein V7642_2621 [Burkholderiales bacterium]